MELEGFYPSNFYQTIWDIFIYGEYYNILDKLDFSGLPKLLGLSKVPTYVLCISIDDYNYMAEEDRYRSRSLIEGTIAQTLKEKEYFLIFAHQNCYYLNGHITDLWSEKNIEKCKSSLIDLASEIKNRVKEAKEISLTIGVDFYLYPLVEKWKEIAQHSIVAQRRKFFEGKDKIYFFIPKESDNLSFPLILSKFYSNLQQRLITAIIKGDTKEANELSINLVKDIFNFTLNRLILLRMKLIETSILIACNLIEIGLPESEVYQLLMDFYEKVSSLHDVINLAETFYGLIQNLVELAVNLNLKLNPIISKIKDLIKSSDDLSNLTLYRISKMINTNYSYISRLFKSEVGITFSEYINRERMKRAFPLIFDKRNNIEDIAIYAGFKNLQHFERVFKKLYNFTPREYRRSIIER